MIPWFWWHEKGYQRRKIWHRTSWKLVLAWNDFICLDYLSFEMHRPGIQIPATSGNRRLPTAATPSFWAAQKAWESIIKCQAFRKLSCFRIQQPNLKIQQDFAHEGFIYLQGRERVVKLEVSLLSGCCGRVNFSWRVCASQRENKRFSLPSSFSV